MIVIVIAFSSNSVIVIVIDNFMDTNQNRNRAPGCLTLNVRVVFLQLNARWLFDLEEFNEWMNEDDYLLTDEQVGVALCQTHDVNLTVIL